MAHDAPYIPELLLDPQFLIDRLDITVVFTVVFTVFKSRVPW
jgi:hypothetical protein